MVQPLKTIEYIWQEIEHLRNQMIEIVKKKGLTSKEALQISRNLDKLLNEYQQIKCTK
jgi:stage 0 sporulation regulatory protein